MGTALSDGSSLKLRAVRFPAGWRTTDEWVEEFLEAITADRTGDRPTPVQHFKIRSPSEQRRSHERARRELKSFGF